MAEASPVDQQHVHVVGCRRSGTTLMMELMWAGYRFGWRCAHEQSAFTPLPETPGPYLTKLPSDAKYIREVFLADERLHVVAMLRDPRAVVCSRHPRRPDGYFNNFRRWRDYHRALLELDAHPRFLLVRFEDLVTRPEAVQGQISARFGFLEERCSFCDFPVDVVVPELAERSLLGLRPLDPTRIDGWREHLPRVKEQLERHPDFPAALIRAGYEPDEGWLSLLDGLKARVSSQEKRQPHLWRRLERQVRYRLKTWRYLRRLDLRSS